jgi:hypothetical protein
MSLVQWIYRGTLPCTNATQLYAVMDLAHQLGVEALHEICLTKLYTAASDSIQNASINNISLRTMLGYGPGPTDDVVEVVFKNVIKDHHNTPKRLQDLFIEVNIRGTMCCAVTNLSQVRLAVKLSRVAF